MVNISWSMILIFFRAPYSFAHLSPADSTNPPVITDVTKAYNDSSGCFIANVSTANRRATLKIDLPFCQQYKGSNNP